MYYLINRIYFFLIYNFKLDINLNIVLDIFKKIHFFLPYNIFYLKACRLSILLRRYDYAYYFLHKVNKNYLDKSNQEKKFFSEVVLFSLKKFTNFSFEKKYHEQISLDFIELLVKMRSDKFFFSENLKNKKILDVIKKNNSFQKKLKTLIYNYIGLDLFCIDLLNLICLDQKIEIESKSLSRSKKINVILDETWFRAFGDIFFLDLLIKGIKLKILPIKKIYIDSKKFSNKYLFQKYNKVLKAEKLILTSKKNDSVKLGLFCWVNNDFKPALSEWMAFKINKLWEEKNKKNLINSSKSEQNSFNSLCRSLNIDRSKKIILINIRQSTKSLIKSIPDFRDYNPENLFHVLEQFNNYNFVIIGDKIDHKFKTKNIHDYSNSSLKNKKNDVLLLFFADACIGSFSGPSHLAAIFGKPILYINCSQFWNFPVTENSFFALSKFYKNNKKISQRDFLKIKPPLIWSNKDSLRSYNISREFISKTELKSFIFNFLEYINKKNIKINYNNELIRYNWWNGDYSFFKNDNTMKNYFNAKVLK